MREPHSKSDVAEGVEGEGAGGAGGAATGATGAGVGTGGACLTGADGGVGGGVGMGALTVGSGVALGGAEDETESGSDTEKLLNAATSSCSSTVTKMGTPTATSVPGSTSTLAM